MSGAYVAKPNVVVVPDIPPGWNLIWSFPGPLPPGYTPDYDATLYAPLVVAFAAGSSSVSPAFYVNDSGYETQKPAGSVTWTFVHSGNGVTLVEPDGGYEQDDNGFWFSDGTFAFISTVPGDTITITAESIPEALDGMAVGERLEGTEVTTVVISGAPLPIPIERAVFTITITNRETPNGNDASIEIGIGDPDSGETFGGIEAYDNTLDTYSGNEVYSSVSFTGYTEIEIEYNEFPGVLYPFYLWPYVFGEGALSIVANAKFYADANDDSLIQEFTKILDYDGSDQTWWKWLLLDTSDNTVTEY